MPGDSMSRMESSFEQSYCSPWDLKLQEEKFQIISQTKKNNAPPNLPPLPPGGLPSSFNTEHGPNDHCALHRLKNNADLSSSLEKDSEPLTFQAALLCFQQMSEDPTLYEQPWDPVQASLFQHLSSTEQRNIESLRKISFPARFRTSSLEDQMTRKTHPIDCYYWFHYAMSRRQAENVLKSRSPGSFLVRQSESGNPNDYSLSIRLAKNSIHMRINHCGGFFILGECSRPFSSISQMIDYFSHVSVPIRGASPTKLTRPVLRCELVSNSN